MTSHNTTWIHTDKGPLIIEGWVRPTGLIFHRLPPEMVPHMVKVEVLDTWKFRTPLCKSVTCLWGVTHAASNTLLLVSPDETCARGHVEMLEATGIDWTAPQDKISSDALNKALRSAQVWLINSLIESFYH